MTTTKELIATTHEWLETGGIDPADASVIRTLLAALEAAQAVSLPDRTLGRLREWASRKIEPEFDEDGDPILSPAYVAGAMGARRDVLQILAALSTQPAAGEVEKRVLTADEEAARATTGYPPRPLLRGKWG